VSKFLLFIMCHNVIAIKLLKSVLIDFFFRLLNLSKLGLCLLKLVVWCR
jgi:hypothetical protein